MLNRRLCIYDLETSGFFYLHDGVAYHRPIQVAIKIVEKDGVTIHDHSAYIKYPRRLSNDVKNTTGITDELLNREGIDIKEAFRSIDRYMNVPQTVIIGHNILYFDNPFLNYYLNRFGYKQINPLACFDTCGHFKGHLIQRSREDKERFYDYHMRVIKKGDQRLHSNLEEACKYYEIPIQDKFHNAVADVNYTYEIFKKQLHDWKNVLPVNFANLSLINKWVLSRPKHHVSRSRQQEEEYRKELNAYILAQKEGNSQSKI